MQTDPLEPGQTVCDPEGADDDTPLPLTDTVLASAVDHDNTAPLLTVGGRCDGEIVSDAVGAAGGGGGGGFGLPAGGDTGSGVTTGGASTSGTGSSAPAAGP